MKRIFGFDIGTTSVGFAVIEIDEEREVGNILWMGARIFPEARDPDGTPLNQQRRAKRMMRRQLRRRRQRRRSLNELLATQGLLPAFGTSEWAKVMAIDPYELRDRGLDAPLSPHELGRALYHLAKRRHFKERDLAEVEEIRSGDEDDEETATTKRKAKSKKTEDAEKDEAESSVERAATIAELKKSGETLGRHLAKIAPMERKRGIHVTRAIVLDEFTRLCNSQLAYHKVLGDPTISGALEEAIFAQRPVFWRKSTLGSCRFIPGAPLCPKGSWLSQQRRMLEKVNNLEIAGGNARPLDAGERAAILAVLETQKSMSWSSVRTALKPIFKARGESENSIRFNLEYGDEKGGLKGNIVEADLAKIFGSNWASHPRKTEPRAFVPNALWQADYGEIGTQRVVIRPETDRAKRRAVLADLLVEDFGATPAQAAALVKLTLPQGWEPYSTKALEIFLVELEKGERFGALVNGPSWENWRNGHFPNREQPTGEILDRLPSPKDREEAQRIAQIRNPTVVRVQNELRKVVNNLIAVYGKPDLIRVELARDVGKSKREREEISAAARKQERRRNDARKDLQSKGINEPSRADIEKWLLWKESQERCPYTGDQIAFDPLFRRGDFEVEHIWPLSRSFDDSFRNKTLCRKDVNQRKGNQTPSEYFRGRPEEWEAAKDRVWKMVGRDGMPPGKAKRFAAETMKDDFASRQLNDTSYAARQAVAMLKRLWPDIGPSAPVTVQAVAGRVTAQLRRLWGLNHILADSGEKTRDDHRHHAIDALVVACTHGGYTEKLSRYFQEIEQRREREKPHLLEPWPSIRKDAEAAVRDIVVSHRVRRKVSGPLHKDTVYGDTRRDETTKGTSYRLLVTRKPVERLSVSEIKDIVDDRVRKTIADFVAAHGGDPKKAFSFYPRAIGGRTLVETVSSESQRLLPEIRKVRLTVKRQLSLAGKVATGYVDLGNNHHVSIYKRSDGKTSFSVVSLMEACQRLSRREPIVRRQNIHGETFVMSLCQGDILKFVVNGKDRIWVVQKIASKGQISLLEVHDASPKEVTLFEPMVGGLMSRNAQKLSVDPIGRVRKAND